MPFIALCILSQIRFENTEVFYPLHRGFTVVTTSSEVFILDKDECRILHYDALGNALTPFGHKGQGPGEFEEPFSLELFRNQLWVQHMNGLITFDLSGNFLKTYSPEKPESMLFPTAFGWLESKSGVNNDRTTYTLEFRLLDENKAQTLSLLRADMPFSKFENNRYVHAFNPARSYPMFSFNPSRTRIVIKKPNSAIVAIYSTGKEPEKLLELDFSDRKSIPFNSIWADKKLEERKERMSGRKKESTFEKDYPDTFPPIRSAGLSPDGLLNVSFWTPKPDQPKMLFFDWDGQPVQRNYSDGWTKRTLAIQNSQAFVAAYDEENEDYIVIRMPLSEADTYIKTHPYTEEF